MTTDKMTPEQALNALTAVISGNDDGTNATACIFGSDEELKSVRGAIAVLREALARSALLDKFMAAVERANNLADRNHKLDRARIAGNAVLKVVSDDH